MTDQASITEWTRWGWQQILYFTEEAVHVWEHDAPEYVKMFGSKMWPWRSREYFSKDSTLYWEIDKEYWDMFDFRKKTFFSCKIIELAYLLHAIYFCDLLQPTDYYLAKKWHGTSECHQHNQWMTLDSKLWSTKRAFQREQYEAKRTDYHRLQRRKFMSENMMLQNMSSCLVPKWDHEAVGSNSEETHCITIVQLCTKILIFSNNRTTIWHWSNIL